MPWLRPKSVISIALRGEDIRPSRRTRSRPLGKTGAIRRALTWVIGLVPLTACAQSIDVLWYTYAHPSSIYIQTIQQLADVVHTLPQSSGVRWKLAFFGPDAPVPAFGNYNVLVIHSGEPGFTGRNYKYLGEPDSKQSYITPDFRGILKNKAAIEAARGERTFISGSDADVHAIWGDTGRAPPDSTGKKQRVTCSKPISATCWDGALGHLVNAVNWAGSGRGLGIVSLVAGEHPNARWWLDPNSFLSAELKGFVTIWGAGTKRENNPVIPAVAQSYPLNSGLTSKGLSNWNNSFHGGISQSVPGYAPIVNSTSYPNTAVAVATSRFASAGTEGPLPAPAAGPQPQQRRRRRPPPHSHERPIPREHDS